MLQLCKSCNRFAREAVCPFCQGEVGEKQSSSGKVRNGVSRGALLVGGALALTACATDTPDGADAAVDMRSDGPLSMADAYGIAPDMPQVDGPLSMADAYGIAPDMASEDAGVEDSDMSIAPAYGIPPGDP